MKGESRGGRVAMGAAGRMTGGEIGTVSAVFLGDGGRGRPAGLTGGVPRAC